jgi:hypothetical protein
MSLDDVARAVRDVFPDAAAVMARALSQRVFLGRITRDEEFVGTGICHNDRVLLSSKLYCLVRIDAGAMKARVTPVLDTFELAATLADADIGMSYGSLRTCLEVAVDGIADRLDAMAYGRGVLFSRGPAVRILDHDRVSVMRADATDEYEVRLASYYAFGESLLSSPCDHTSLAFRRIDDAIVCRGCGLSVSGEAMAFMGFSQKDRYSRTGNALADECQILRDENARLHAELSRWERGLVRDRSKP